MHEDYKDIGHIKDCLIEEIGELLQAWGKYYRFGATSRHPDEPTGKMNYEQLLDEIDDVEKRLKQFKMIITTENIYEIEYRSSKNKND